MPEQTTDSAQASEPLSNADSPELLGRLMVYLFCVASCIESKILDDYITDYKQFASLSLSQSRTVLGAALDLSPQDLSDKIIRCVGEDLGDNFVSAMSFSPPYRKEMVVLGRKVEITFKKTLLCSSAWRNKFYENPMEQLPVDVIGTRHCSHCLGNGSACNCSKCERFRWSRCRLPDAPIVQGHRVQTAATHLRDPSWLPGGLSYTSSGIQYAPTAYHANSSASGDSESLTSVSQLSPLCGPDSPTPTESVRGSSPTTPRQLVSKSHQGQGKTAQDDIPVQPCIIIVMGPTGSGKSTFISEAIGQEVGIIGDHLTSFTEEVQAFPVPRDIFGDTEVVLVDTPGFDDTNKPDYEIFKKVAKWLNAEMKNNRGIAGLIYLHRITDNRMAGTPLKNLEMFRELCGKKMMTSVVLMTTMWPNDPKTQEVPGMREVVQKSDESLPVLENREKELRGKYFKAFIRLGATLTRFGNNQASAAQILGPLVYAWSLREEEERLYRVVRLQKEINNYRLTIEQTSAAREVYDKVRNSIEEQRSILEKVDVLVAEAGNSNRDDLDQALQDFARISDDLAVAQEGAARLRLNLSGHLKVFVVKLQRKLHPLIDIARQVQLSTRIKSQISLEGIQEGDKVIIVAGVTGSGMSTFISRALGEDVGARRLVSAVGDDAKTAQLMGNRTRTVTDINTGKKETAKSYTRDVKFFRSSNSKIVFVDTPGFDNDEQALSNLVIQNKIIRLLELLPSKAKFSGFIFLHNAAKPSCIINLSLAIGAFSETFKKTYMKTAVVAIFKEKQVEVSAEMRKSVGMLLFPVEIFADSRESVKVILKKLLDQKSSVIPPNFSATPASVKRTT